MKKLKIIIPLLFISYIIYACWEKVDFENLKISNKSNTSIYVSISNDDQIFDYAKFLILQKIKKGENLNEIDITDLYLSDIILPKETVEISRPMVWDDYINSSKDKKIRLFVIEKDSVDKYGWEYIHKENIYNKKHTLTFKSLEKMKWKLVYNNGG